MLNLLPETQQRTVAHTLILLAIQRLAAVIFIVASGLAIILLTARIILLHQFQAIAVESTFMTSNRVPSLQREVTQINEILNHLDAIQKNFHLTTPLIADLAARTPPTITLTRFHIEHGTQHITIEGMAETREALLAYVTQLKASPYLEQILNPLRNIVQAENENFVINAIVKPGSLTLIP